MNTRPHRSQAIMKPAKSTPQSTISSPSINASTTARSRLWRTRSPRQTSDWSRYRSNLAKYLVPISLILVGCTNAAYQSRPQPRSPTISERGPVNGHSYPISSRRSIADSPWSLMAFESGCRIDRLHQRNQIHGNESRIACQSIREFVYLCNCRGSLHRPMGRKTVVLAPSKTKSGSLRIPADVPKLLGSGIRL